ncbi:MAG: hypothetical protein PHW63_01795 [Alphaproteobacteria bacterium]|nr:hypothetical protein [Alphaproteobacteria bacterium]
MAKDKKPEGKAKKKGGGKTVLLMTLFGCFVPFGLPTLVVCLGLTPTLVALLTDTDERRSELAAVGYLNFAGVLPFMVELWQHGQTMEFALSIMGQSTTWAVMLGAAGLGHLILYLVPPIVGSVVRINQESRLRTLKEGTAQLEAIWGPDVATESSLSEVLHNRGL